ncbi:lipopolysaccharide biosynthesis protein [Weissella paramesenteroides]|uniref:lipopolysaccharide biosynthesis protein n=1 Tax=Weissella paramesenteroides TaxID=1249 RepID=UPI003F748028
MNNLTRTKAALMNSSIAAVAQIINLILNFVSRTFFIRILGEQFLGLNGLFVNLLNILAFSELGIGSAITFALYRPLAEKDIPQVKALMELYKKAFHIIAIIVVIGGMFIMPFLPKMIAGSANVGNVFFAFTLYLSNSALSYLWSYKRSILIASQLGYINTVNQMVFNVVLQVVQIMFLFLMPSYSLYLAIQIIFTIASNYQISKLANKKFSYLTEKNIDKVEPSVISYLKKNIIGMLSSKIGGVVVFGTDNIIISTFIGLAAVGRYSNYTLVLNGINSVITQLVNAVTPSIGNFKINKDKKDQINLFYKYTQLNAYIILGASMMLIMLFPSFIQLWIGEKYRLSDTLTMIIVLGFFINGLRNSNLNFMNAYGTFWEMRFKSLWEAGVNLILSLLLINFTKLGIGAVVLGTIGANLLINSWWEPYIVLRNGINTLEKKYIGLYISILVLGSMFITLTQKIGDWMAKINFLVALIISVLISIIILLVFHCTLVVLYPKKYEPLRLKDLVGTVAKFFN